MKVVACAGAARCVQLAARYQSGALGGDQAGLLGFLDHVEGDAILHAAHMRDAKVRGCWSEGGPRMWPYLRQGLTISSLHAILA